MAVVNNFAYNGLIWKFDLDLHLCQAECKTLSNQDFAFLEIDVMPAGLYA